MKRGSKKIEKDDAVSRKPEPEEAGSKKTGGDDSGTFRQTREMIGGNPNGIDAIRALQMIAGGIAALVLIWLILHNILHII
ncbi:MAG: hypothetical protein WC379_10990 [Methanoregula sp.]